MANGSYLLIIKDVATSSGPEAWSTDSGSLFTAISLNDGNRIRANLGALTGTYLIHFDLDTSIVIFDDTLSTGGLSWVGTWNILTAYSAFAGEINVVLYSGQYYRALGNSTGSQPDISPADWKLIQHQTVAGLQSGFNVLTGRLHIMNWTRTGSGGGWYAQFDSLTESTEFTGFAGADDTFDYVTIPTTMLNLVNNGCGLRVLGLPTNFFKFDQQYVEGTYNIISTGWTLPLTTVKAGDKVTLTSISNLAQGVTGVQFGTQPTKVASQDFLEQTPTQITFYMPEFGNVTGPLSVSVVGNGVQFSGTVLLGPLTVLFVDASGIYVLTNLKPSDTLYDRTTPGATVEV